MLDQDMKLGFNSISMADGHAGTEITFEAATREIVFSKWCVRKAKFQLPFGKKRYSEKRSEERYPVPRNILTEEALRRYVAEKWPLYFR